MRKMLLIAATFLAALSMSAEANDRYRERPPVVVSPDLTAPWILQLGREQRPVHNYRARPPEPRVLYRARPQPLVQERPTYRRDATQPDFPPDRPRILAPRPILPQARAPRPVQTAAMRVPVIRGQLHPQYLPQIVDYQSNRAPGTIIIDTNNRFLYLVMEGGKARRYGVGVGKPGFEWAGTHTVTRKAEWPSWHPPKEMIAREAAKGHFLPVKMEGGPENPLGARALYLGSTLYRIHGTNAPWTIGNAVSSGCIRMRNEDVTDLYQRVDVGTKVVVM
ncbi:L,D-transpeptidase [Rhizobium sp. SSA_523]|uniref:L,D-transpeptidase n=1 Tax=Rhizobium sp. SSA_523 TaxID=2952477 RepID=UPI002091BFFD|nr:L,D-transpeptidase [Rhizobium sp. SSA_523]MCO5733165.1 L,D-transpeptidase [Rhizobium sp. SSA_523]WKC24036.1 L,D-transpeptidase [Rhizobium sp. SSA_523]